MIDAFLNLDENLFRAFDNREFKNWVNSDIWNQYIYQSIIKNSLSKKYNISKTNLKINRNIQKMRKLYLLKILKKEN